MPLMNRDQWAVSDPGLRMHSWIEDLPGQMRRAAAFWPGEAAEKMPDRGVVAAAMGGSAMAAQVALYSVRATLPSMVVRGDTLPEWVGPGWLCVTCSYSGNTRETLACFEQACRRGCTVASVSAGGVLQDLAASQGFVHRAMAAGQPPRTAVGQAVVGLLWILWTHGLLADPRPEIEAAAATLGTQWARGIGSSTPWETEPGRIARAVSSACVMVAGAGLSLAPALRWSQQLNENAKLPCFALEVPEMLHNQVEGLEAAARAGAVLVLLTDHGQSYSEGAAMDYLGSVYEGFGGTSFAVASRGTHELERIFSLMYIGDQVSYLASLLRGMDPTPVERIGHLKKVLAPGSS